jgi:hypothetical protein
MYLAGANAPPAQVQGQLVAPVVQAPQHAQQGEVKGLIMEFVHEAVKTAGGQVGQHAMSGMMGWS